MEENISNDKNQENKQEKIKSDSKRDSKKESNKPNNKKRKQLMKNIRFLIIKFLFIVLLFYITFFYLFGLTRMKNLAMKPSIEPGSLVLYYRLDKDYHVGDVVTFQKDGKRYVLRIVATQNQTVSLNMDGEFITSDGNEQHQTYFENIIPEGSNITYPYKVGNNQVFVVGDYRVETEDSRIFGAIDMDIIDGKVISLLQTKDI
ncbi:MAG: signal peptidase I [Clostridia bacterium]|nr:signal peptidase I [Clostridia bacterium]